MPPPHADDELLLHPLASPPNPADSWGPFSDARDFVTTMAIILAGLFSTVLLAFLLAAAVRLLLARRRRRRRQSEEQVDPEKSAAAVSVPMTLFSAAGTRLAGAVAECTICLTEFAEGDAVRVLPACNHGFHGQCVEQWLATRGSCPTCRAACSVAQTHGPPMKPNPSSEV